MEFIFSFRFLVFWLLAALCSHLAFREHPALETCLYARFLLDRFCAGYDSASQAGGETEEPIYSQALLLEPRHGLPPPPPQIALRFAAQIILEERAKIQATALCRRAGRSNTAKAPRHSEAATTFARWLLVFRENFAQGRARCVIAAHAVNTASRRSGRRT